MAAMRLSIVTTAITGHEARWSRSALRRPPPCRRPSGEVVSVELIEWLLPFERRRQDDTTALPQGTDRRSCGLRRILAVRLRSSAKHALAAWPRRRPAASGVTLLTYHRVGGGTGDELDLSEGSFVSQLDALTACGLDVLSLDAALDRLDEGRDHPASVVLTFDDGFGDVHARAFRHLERRRLPFTVYLAAGLVGGTMLWEGSNASSQGAQALQWSEIETMVASGLCTIANHTMTHAGPERLTVGEIDACSDEIESRVGYRPGHFAWTWGRPVERLLPDIRERFRSAATGEVGRNHPDTDRHALRRVPVRASDPLSFFEAKLTGDLWAERTYGRLVETAKRAARLMPRG